MAAVVTVLGISGLTGQVSAQTGDVGTAENPYERFYTKYVVFEPVTSTPTGIPDGALHLRSASSLSAIPVPGLLHQYDWSDGSTTTSTVPDLAGDDDLTGGFTDLNATINGVQAGNFDGTADSVSGAFSSSVAQPVEIYSVTETSNNGDTQIITTGTNNNNITAKRFGTTDFVYQLNAGNNINGGSAASNDPELLTTRFDGGSSLLRVNGSEELSGPAGTNGMDGLVVSRDDLPVDGAVAEVLVYDPTVSDYSRSDVEQYLADKWGITLA